MTEPASLYIERSDCSNCCRCIRECPQKAIYFSDGSAVIDRRMCIQCGSCITMCKAGKVRIREDIHIARKMIKEGRVTVASVAPQWMTEFEGMDSGKFIEILRLLGFSHVSETALGACVTMRAESEYALSAGGYSISSRCPAVNNYIVKYKPHLREKLIPVASPMVAHARMIKQWWGTETSVIHITGCTAAKTEASRYNEVDQVITFRELKKWIKDEGIQMEKITGNAGYTFEPFRPDKGHKYQLCDAVRPHTDKMITFGHSTMIRVSEALSSIPSNGEYPVYLDLMACRGGCIGSNGSTAAAISNIKQRIVFENAGIIIDKESEKVFPEISLAAVFPESDYDEKFVSEGDTLVALDELGLSLATEQTDCNGCGFGKCRRFAKALSLGLVEKELCTQYLRRETTARLNSLVQRIASGVAIVGNNLRIELANRNIARMVGSDAEFLYDENPGLKGVSAQDIFPFTPLISHVLENGDETLVRDFQVRENLITVSIHSVVRYKTVIVICRNMLFSQVRNEEIVSRTQKVIDDNLETVRKIAGLLGENASRTEAILNTILNAQTDRDDS